MRTFGFESTADEVTDGLDLRGQCYLVTGCNSGLGLETTRVLSARGAHIIGAARTQVKAEAALTALGVDGTPVQCELSEPTSVRDCAETLNALGRPINAMICNAGVMALPEPQTKYGIDLQLLTNHIGHFLLVTRSLEALAADGRVVMLSSRLHGKAPDAGIEFDNLSGERGYDPWKMYGQSKLANILFTKQLAKQFAASNRTANAAHPGVIPTGLVRHISNAEEIWAKVKLKTLEQGAATQCLVATHPELATVSGQYFVDCHVEDTIHPQATNMELAEQLWERSEEIVAGLL